MLSSYNPKKENHCIICGDPQVDRCHIISRGSGGSDDEWNIFFACRFHHSEQHQIGIFSFAEKYGIFKNLLKERGFKNKPFGRGIYMPGGRYE
tara:strand:- start:185 stop:463 length:279 start_codon:yes stop_codon:yes gene_type:complete